MACKTSGKCLCVLSLTRLQALQLDINELCCDECCAVLPPLLPQAPLELLLGPGWSNTCESDPGAAPRCSLPQLLGFCKLLSWREVLDPTPASAADSAPISYSYSFAYGPFAGWACLSLLRTSGAAADLVLWALLRLQYKLFKSHTYTQVSSRVALSKCIQDTSPHRPILLKASSSG